MRLLDISHWQTKIDWEKIKDPVILKCSESTDYLDPTFKERQKILREKGLYFGSYHFFRDTDIDEQVDFYLANADWKEGEITVLDFEIDCPDAERKCKEFLSKLPNPYFYTNEARMNKLNIPYPLWIARYGTNDGTIQIEPTKEWTIWQYTSKGKVEGIEGNVDLNILKDNPITSNNMYYRYGHEKDVFVKVGDRVKKGSKIGTVGTGNGQYINAAHCHFDIPRKKLAKWTDYVFGMTSKQVEDLYADPQEYRDTVAPWFDHMGWMYLEYATYGSKTCYHPGEDLNGKGGGDSDLGLPLYSACDGEVVYVYDGTGTNGGWGKLIVIEEKPEEVKPIEVNEIDKLKEENKSLLALTNELTNNLEQCKDVMYDCLNKQTKCDHSITELLNMLISKILWRKK